MKKFLIVFSLLLMTAGAYANPVDIDKRVLKTFETRFPNAQEASWHELSDEYLVNFVEKGIRSRITYKKDGTLISFIRYYQEENLPYHIQAKIKEKHADKKILGVTEVTDDYASVEYYVKLSDDKELLTVKIDSNGFLTVTEKFKNGSVK